MEIAKHGLKRELKLQDLVFMQVVLIFSLVWIGFAAKQGSSEIILWLFAIAFFYLPLAAVVMKLSRAMPVEGGVYQWTKNGLSAFAGFMAAWNICVYAIFVFSSIGSGLANGFAWAAGPSGSWMTSSKAFALALTAFFCLLTYFVNVCGLHIAKWFCAAVSLLWISIFILLLYLLIKAWAFGTPLAHRSLSLTWPSFSLLTISILAKMAIGGLSGFDNSAIFADECRKPGSDISSSVLIAAPLIALMYIVGTSALLAYTTPENIDVAAPVQQVIHAEFGNYGLGTALSTVAVLALSIALIASGMIYIGAVARLPMVAGWDGLLPSWWSELHASFRTPSKAIGAVSGSVMLAGTLSLWGTGNQEAVQLTFSAGLASLCLMYMLLFGVILFGSRSVLPRPGVGVWLAALAAFCVAGISLVCEIVPVGEVTSPGLFAVKVTLAICIANALGAYLYWRGTRREARVD